MQEKKRKGAMTPNKKLDKKSEEILIAKNRGIAPFVLTFSYEAENIALQPLGNLFGIFSLSDRSEDSEYIGNCLAAVMKKEYFANPRRSPSDSFESALHRANLTLGKLVREGHVHWMGKLHGVLCAVQGNEIHFSASGNGTLILFRDGTCSQISDGMYSEESLENPLKTFTDISSGTLLPKDRLILTSPELLEVVSLQDISRQCAKLDRDRFSQFIKTALVNNYSQAAALVIDIFEIEGIEKQALQYADEEEVKKEHAEKPSEMTYIENIFSSALFEQRTKKRAPEKKDRQRKKESLSDEKIFAENQQKQEPISERIDSRTGHIYLRAEEESIEEKSGKIEEFMLFFQENVSLFFLRSKKYAQRGGSEIFHFLKNTGHTCVFLIEKILRKGFYFINKTRENLQAHIFSESAESENQIKNLSFKETPQETKLTEKLPPPEEISQKKISSIQEKFSFFLNSTKNIFSSLNELQKKLRETALCIFQKIKMLSPKKRNFIFSGVAIFFILFLSWSVFSSNEKSTESDTQSISLVEVAPSEEPFPPANEALAKKISGKEVLSVDGTEGPVIPITLNEKLFILTKRSIINMENKLSLSMPEKASPILHATSMDDLNAIFLYGSDKKIYLYYPNAKSLVENTFPIPENFSVDDIGTYLTYLYAFDAKQGRILRFPRAEGGFGEPTEWLKESYTFDENATISIGENIFIASKDTIFSFSKGKGGPISFEKPTAPLTIKDLEILEDNSLLLLDPSEKRILQISPDGKITNQYFDKNIEKATSLESVFQGTTLFLSKKEAVFSYSL